MVVEEEEEEEAGWSMYGSDAVPASALAASTFAAFLTPPTPKKIQKSREYSLEYVSGGVFFFFLTIFCFFCYLSPRPPHFFLIWV